MCDTAAATMSGPFRSPGNDPFEGGARFALAPPTGSSGTLGPPGGGVQNPLAVSAPGIKMARNNRGSNIQIPHARVVPLSPADTALPDITNLDGIVAFALQARGGADQGQMGLTMLESEAIAPGRIGFVLGHRSLSGGSGSITLPGFAPYGASSGGWAVARGIGNGVDRVDRMCSFEYWARYFAIVLRRVHTTLGGAIAYDPNGVNVQWSDQRPYRTLIDTNDVVHARDAAAGGTATAGAVPMGITAFDIHPFIRGKSLVNKLVTIKKHRHSRAAGDLIAISALEKILGDKGLFDWRPDGVVVGKEDSGQGSVEMDNAFDARLQQLFNVAVQGPAITTSCVYGSNTLSWFLSSLRFAPPKFPRSQVRRQSQADVAPG